MPGVHGVLSVDFLDFGGQNLEEGGEIHYVISMVFEVDAIVEVA